MHPFFYDLILDLQLVLWDAMGRQSMLSGCMEIVGLSGAEKDREVRALVAV